MTLAKVQAEVKRLSPREQAELLDWLWEGMQSQATRQIQQRWLTEAEKRIEAVERGALSTVPGAEAVAAARRSLQS